MLHQQLPRSFCRQRSRLSSPRLASPRLASPRLPPRTWPHQQGDVGGVRCETHICAKPETELSNQSSAAGGCAAQEKTLVFCSMKTILRKNNPAFMASYSYMRLKLKAVHDTIQGIAERKGKEVTRHVVAQRQPDSLYYRRLCSTRLLAPLLLLS
jgi:hypothetical protein